MIKVFSLKIDFSVRPLALAVAVSLTGCAVGPNFRQPDFPVVDHFARAEVQAPAASTGTTLALEFWTRFNDPQLTALVEHALAANGDLRTAMAHCAMASAMLRESEFDQLPQVTASAAAGHEKMSVDQAFGYPRSERTYSVDAMASWELDLFGRVRREVEAQRAESKADEADFAALQVAIAANTASTYMQLRGLQEQLRVVRENISNQKQMMQLVDNRLSAGRGTEFDSTRARAQFEITSAREPALQAQIAVAQHRLAVLTGQTPEALIGQLDDVQPMPALPQGIALDAPADLLRRRPDIAAAEARLHAATAQIGVATGDLFPKLSLNAMVGNQAFDTGSMFHSSSAMNFALLGVDWSFLDVGRVRARLAATRAGADGMLAQYQQTVLLALEDTENALVRFSRARNEDELLDKAARDSAQAARLARIRYQAGEIGMYELLDAERVLLDTQEAYADCHTRNAIATVGLYKALAGGWPTKMTATTQPMGKMAGDVASRETQADKWLHD